MISNIVCPISAERVDSNVSRLTVFFNAALMIVYLLTQNPIPMIVVALDYGVRAFGYNQYSPLCFIANLIIELIGSKPKMVDKAPKVFASRLGWICAILGVVFYYAGWGVASMSIIGFFTILALLDSVANFCVGCLIYHTFVFPFFQRG